MGKKRQFNEAEVLDQIANHFWKHGYSATKVDQLSDVTGLTKTSLYNAFGNKEALFSQAIDHYVKISIEQLFDSINLNKKLSENMKVILNNTFKASKNSKMTNGCLLTNSIVELNSNEDFLHEHVTKLCEQVRKEKIKLFSHYIDNGCIDPAYSTEELTDFFMTFWQGLRVQSRNHSPANKLKNSTIVFLKFIQSIEI